MATYGEQFVVAEAPAGWPAARSHLIQRPRVVEFLWELRQKQLDGARLKG